MNPKRDLAFIFFFSILTHLPGFFNPILDYHGWAQTLRASIARNFSEGDMNFFQPHVDFRGDNPRPASTQFPLYSYLIACLYRLFGENEIWGRIISILFAAFSSISLYHLVNRNFDRRSAFWSSLIFSLIPIRIYFTRTVMPEAMSLFCLIQGYDCVFRWLEFYRFWPWGLTACLLLSLAGLLKLPYIFLLAPALFLLYRGKRMKEFLVLSAAIFLLVGGWYGYTALGLPALSAEGHFFASELNWWQEWSGGEFWSSLFLSRFPELLTTYAGLLFLVVGYLVLWRKRESFFLIWFLTVLLYTIFSGKYGRVHQYASLPFAPINALFIALGFLYCWDKGKEKPGAKLILSLLLLSIPLHAYLRIKHWYRCEEVWVFRAKEAVQKISSPTDLFYIYAQDQPFYLYHIHRKGYTASLYPYGSDAFETVARKIRFILVPGSQPPRDLEEKYTLAVQDKDFLIYEGRKNN
ncbi:MAG: glycosyltransferase family 39 protein [Elusimicrobia bacterium]|nr:glycosyltransferase family 39 protein [Elusimicrobiota bacterium]